jgi:hypothetical protein
MVLAAPCQCGTVLPGLITCVQGCTAAVLRSALLWCEELSDVSVICPLDVLEVSTAAEARLPVCCCVAPEWPGPDSAICGCAQPSQRCGCAMNNTVDMLLSLGSPQHAALTSYSVPAWLLMLSVVCKPVVGYTCCVRSLLLVPLHCCWPCML